jgi:hypothetical protein
MIHTNSYYEPFLREMQEKFGDEKSGPEVKEE